jgi:hypothetical protein
MTEGELEILRLKVKVEVLQLLLRGLYTGLANSSPGGAQAYRDQFSYLRKEQSQIVIRPTSPAYSELVAAEYQDALDDVLLYIEGGFSDRPAH